MQEKILHKIKKFILPDFNIGEDFDFILLKIIQLFEISSIFIFSFVLVLDFFIPFNEISTYYFIFGLSLSLIIKSFSLKSKELKVNLFIVLLYTVCIFSNLFESFFYLYYLSLFFYISIFKNLKTSILNLIFSIILILFISNYFKYENVGEIDIIFNIIFPRVIFVFSLISLTIILLLHEIISLLKLKVDLSFKQTGELSSKEMEQQRLIKQLKEEAEINEKIRLNLEESKEYFKNIINNVSDSIILVKKDGKIILANESAIMKYGLDDEFFENKVYFDLITPEYRKNVPQRLFEIKEKGQHYFESEHIDKNNETFNTEISTRYIQFEGQEVLMIIIKDISARKKKEEKDEEIKSKLKQMVEDRTAQLEDAMNELRVEIQNKVKTEQELIEAKNDLLHSLEIEKEYSELKTRFVAMISHEYRTPLTVILSNTYILEHYFDSQERDKFIQNIERIQKSVQTMTTLLEDVMEIGKSENQISKLMIQRFDVVNTICEVMDEIKSIEKITHNYIINTNIKSLIINSDEKLFFHILRNLVHNACKYSEKDKSITLSLEIDGNKMIIIVVDEGIGIPNDSLEHLFEPFFRSDNVGAREGTGLGLSLTKRYIEALNGIIEVESVENVGSTFKLTLPLGEYEIFEKDDKQHT